MSSMTISPLSYTQTQVAHDASAAAQQSGATTQSSSAGGVSADEGTFLTLLVSQLKNQDPLNPTDSTQFVSELAQFSSLEQLININQNVSTMTNTVSGANSASTSTDALTGAADTSAAASNSTDDNTLLNSIG